VFLFGPLDPLRRADPSGREFVALEPPAAGVLRTAESERFARVPAGGHKAENSRLQAGFGACDPMAPRAMTVTRPLKGAKRAKYFSLAPLTLLNELAAHASL